MKKPSLLSSTLGVLVCLTQGALGQTPATPAKPAATSTAAPATPAKPSATPPAASAAPAPAAAGAATPAPAASASTTTAPAALATTDATATTAATDAAPAPAAEADTQAAAAEATPPPVPDQPAPAATALETKAEAAPPPPVTVTQLPYMKRYLPEGNMWELGLLGGLMFPSSEHQLFDPSLGTGAQRPFNTAGEIGVRAAYFPLSFVGVEVEAAAMPTSVDVGTDPVGTAGGLWAFRGQIVGQYPGWSVTPFAVVGFGALGASSDAMGNDIDDAWHFGAGVKVPIDEHLSARLDIRDTVHRQVNSSSGTGTHSPEILIGLTFVPKRKKPDHDKDGYVDYSDECPAVAGEGDDCPPPDVDQDGVVDEKDECPADAGVAPTGCPDSDGDGFLDRADPCPNLAGPAPSGCPEKECPVSDTDGDGITDAADQCPAEAAATVTGCPPKDTDGDTIPDDADQCPAEAETKDGVADDDGCPEPTEPAKPEDKAATKGAVDAKPAPAASAAAATAAAPTKPSTTTAPTKPGTTTAPTKPAP